MSKMNLLVHINAYEDGNATNNPSMNHTKWNRDIQGIDVSEPASKGLQLQPGQSLDLFAGVVSTLADATTTWDMALKSGSTNTYRISHAGGTAPAFRTARTEDHDATTEVTITKNAKLLKFESTGGTVFDLVTGAVQVGDCVRIGDSFNVSNRGTFKILAFDATSFTVENENGQAEGPIILGATFADQVNIYSADGVQIGDKVDIVAGFSVVTQGTYNIVDVSHDFIDFYSIDSLPTESGVSNSPDALLIYRDAKQFIYIESDKKLSVTLDNSSISQIIEPFKVGTDRKPGIFMLQSSIKSAVIENKSQEVASVFFVTAG